MKEFTTLVFDPIQCRQEILALKALLTANPALEENKDLKPLFERSRHLSAWLGTYGRGWLQTDLLAFQYQLFGDFACDLAVGDSTSRAFGFVELEDATPGGLFRRQGAKAVLEWSTRFEKAFSQVVDWFWKLEDMAGTADFDSRFGRRDASYFGLVVMGRSADLTHPRELARWRWRQRKVLVNSLPVHCVTYDDLCEELLARLASRYAPAGGGTPET